MPIKIDNIISAGLFTIDGEKVMDLTNSFVDTFSEDDMSVSESEAYLSKLPAYETEYTFTCKYWPSAYRILNKLSYGWRAKGPIRKRLLRRLWYARSEEN